MTKPHVAITGASGFVGQYLADALAQTGARITLLSRETTDYSFDSLTDILTDVDTVIHLAGRRMTREDTSDDLTPFLEPNVILTGRLCDAAKACGVRRFVLASTIAVYSPQGETPYTEQTATAPINAYALSKKMAEDYLALKTGIDVVCLRLAALYGHGEKGTPALMRFINQASAKTQITLSGNLNYGIDQLYIRDAVSALMTAMSQDAAPGTYNIGAGQVHTIGDLAEMTNRVFDNANNLDATAATDGPRNRTFMTISHAQTKLNWQPSYTLERGLEDVRKMQDTQI